MIVIAILGILAAVAIPNFISYRNKGFCSRVEADAQNVVAAVIDYFAIPAHSLIPAVAQLSGIALSGANTATIDNVGGDPTVGMTITVTDGSGRCPTGGRYQDRVPGWSNTAPGVFTKTIPPS